MQSWHALTLLSISIDSLEKRGDKALIAFWARQCALFSTGESGHSSTTGSSMWAFFQLQGVPPVGYFSPEKCHPFTNEQWHQVSTEAEICVGEQSFYGVYTALPLALQILRHGLGAQFWKMDPGEHRNTMCRATCCTGSSSVPIRPVGAQGIMAEQHWPSHEGRIDSWVWMIKT